MASAAYWIKHLNLEPHPEGGNYRESYRSKGVIAASGLPSYVGSRNFCTAIYYLLKGDEHSKFHRLKSDEVWHFYDGCSLRLFVIQPDGSMITKVLGRKVEDGESLQHIIPANHWFAAQPVDRKSFTLAGCTMAPGFDFKDFEIISLDQLTGLFPQLNQELTLLIKT